MRINLGSIFGGPDYEGKTVPHDPVWGKLPKLRLPSSIIDKSTGDLHLNNYALNVLIAMLMIQRNETMRRKKIQVLLEEQAAVVKADRKSLMRITGISKNLITNGIHSLENARYVRRVVPFDPGTKQELRGDRNTDGQFAVREYALLDPRTEKGLRTRSGSGLLYANRLHYFALPVVMLKRHPKTIVEPYHFDSMTLPVKRLYIVLAWLAQQENAPEYDVAGPRLKKLTGLSSRAVKKAMHDLETRRLVADTAQDLSIRNFHIVLRNPYSQELLGFSTFDSNSRNNAQNWYEEFSPGRSRRFDTRISPELAERLFLEQIQELGEVAIREGNGEYKFRCPFHNDSKPSCNFNPIKGCFYCFSGACGAKGTTLTLLKKLSGKGGEETIQRIAQVMGKKLEYNEPDWEAVDIYGYRDKLGELKKQVIRLRDDANGNRRFTQRRKGKTGWIYDLTGLKPMLFNLDLFEFAHTVFITEGEKDARTVTDLKLNGGELSPLRVAIGTTSGGADSWQPHFAKELKKFATVIVLPDDDEAGESYAQAVLQSLDAEGVHAHVVSFKGTGAKDVTEFMQSHSVEDLVRLIGVERISMPDGTLLDNSTDRNDELFEQITF